MKQGTLITKIIMLILFVGVALYLGVYAVRTLSDPLTTAIAYQDVLDDAVEVTGLVVREERVLSNGAAIMDVLPDEGERVASGETVAVLYQNSEALERERLLQTLELELEQLKYALDSGSSLGDAARLEQQIVDSILTLRVSAAGDNLSTLKTDALSLRTQVLQRDFAYSASADSAAELKQAISDLTREIDQLKNQASYDTSLVKAPCSGLFSQLADGLEAKLTPELLNTVSAAQLDVLADTAAPVADDCVGKLITGDRWYFATAVDQATADRLLEGDTITVAFSRDFSGEVDMRVERIGVPEVTGCVLILSSNRHLNDITLLREQTVSLVFERFTGVRVPKRALRLETVSYTDSDTGNTVESKVTGVYTVVGARAEFKPVDIVREGSDYYLVKPAQQSDYFRLLSAAAAKRRVLRAGDELIITAPDLYDGKVVLD